MTAVLGVFYLSCWFRFHLVKQLTWPKGLACWQFFAAKKALYPTCAPNTNPLRSRSLSLARTFCSKTLWPCQILRHSFMMFHAESKWIKRHQQSQVLVSAFRKPFWLHAASPCFAWTCRATEKPGGPGRATAGDQEPRLARSGMQFSSIIVAKGTVTSQDAAVADLLVFRDPHTKRVQFQNIWSLS